MREALAAHASEQVAQEPSSEHWRKAIGEWLAHPKSVHVERIEQRARELQEAK
jgi:hypothetical protein